MNLKTDIHWQSFIIGSAFCAFIASFAFNQGFDWLIAFASIGLLWVGYKGKNMVWGTVLGAIGALPLYVIAVYGGFGPISTEAFDITTMMILLLIVVLILGAMLGFVGTLFNKNRSKAIAEKERKAKIGKNKTKKKKNK